MILFWETTVFTLVLLCLCKVLATYKICKSPLTSIPGPKPVPLFGNALMLLGPSEKVWWALMRRLKDEFGNVVLFYFASKPMVFLFEAQGAEKLLSSTRNISKGFQYEYIWPWLGQGLLTSTGQKWQKHRKLITPAFHFRILEDFLDVMIDQTETLVDKLGEQVGKKVDICPYISLCSLDIICETAMGTKIGAQHDSSSPYVIAVYNSIKLA